MHFAQLMLKHNAQLPVMQAAYDFWMEIDRDSSPDDAPERPMRRARRLRLEMLIDEAGGATQLARLTGTPKSHISAVQAGRRDVGDALATKLEEKMGKPFGWMDGPGQPGEAPEVDAATWRTLAFNAALGAPNNSDSLLDFCRRIDLELKRVHEAQQPVLSVTPPKG